jgi:hypothetical protein
VISKSDLAYYYKQCIDEIEEVRRRGYEDVWDNISQEELDYYKRTSLEVPPEPIILSVHYFEVLCLHLFLSDGYFFGEC